MAKRGSVSGTWKSDKDNISVNLAVILFEEDGSKIMYCPALDVSGYGKTEEEAQQSFNIALGEFFLYTTRKKTFISEMERLGWTIRSKHKSLQPPSMSELLNNNDNFSRIFNSFPFRKIDQSISLPC